MSTILSDLLKHLVEKNSKNTEDAIGLLTSPVDMLTLTGSAWIYQGIQMAIMLRGVGVLKKELISGGITNLMIRVLQEKREEIEEQGRRLEGEMKEWKERGGR